MDLTNTICIVQYKNENAKNEYNQPDGGHIYIVPFYDVTYLSGEDEGKVLIPWCISGPATAAAGPITFAVEFFLLSEDKKSIIYKLNTQPAHSKILHGLNVTNGDDFVLMPTEYEQLLAEIQSIRDIKEATIYWYET